MKLEHRRKGHKAWLVSIDSYLNRHVSSFEALVMMIGVGVGGVNWVSRAVHVTPPPLLWAESRN